MGKLIGGIKSFISSIVNDKKKLGIAVVVILVFLFILRGCAVSNKEQKLRQEALDRANAMQEEPVEEEVDTESDVYLLRVQPDLIKAYGNLPEGYIWDIDGSLMSLGDKDMTAEEVVYAYLNGLRTLDLSMAQKYSRYSKVVETYESYFDSQNSFESDYFDAFMRNMYKEALLSMQIQGIVDNSVFAENKQIFTVKVKMLDLTDKDFWEKDKLDLYQTLYVYSRDEDDSTKSEMYLYNYVLNHYQSKDAKTRTVTFDITVERYPDLDTGWLVSIDTDVNDACMYTDGTLMVNYINTMYMDEGIDYIDDIREAEKESVENGGDLTQGMDGLFEDGPAEDNISDGDANPTEAENPSTEEGVEGSEGHTENQQPQDNTGEATN